MNQPDNNTSSELPKIYNKSLVRQPTLKVPSASVKVSDMPNIQDEKHSCAVYTEFKAGHPANHKLDFDSPRTMRAAKEVGITFADCVLK